MGRGRAIVFALATFAVAETGTAQTTADELLSCAAEFAARAIYVETLGHSEAGHVTFLRGRSDIFLRLAEARAPKEVIGCGSNGGPIVDLVLRFGPADLHDEWESLTSDRLIGLVEEHHGHHRLSVCMVDETCAACTATFSTLVRIQFPKAWKTTPPFNARP
jgi:hypothetical protein